MDLGFEAMGFSLAGAVEIEAYACSTLRRNFPQAYVVGPPEHEGDAAAISPEDFAGLTGVNGDLAVLTAGPPCQPFSIAANQRFSKRGPNFKRIGFDDERRGSLAFLLIDYLEVLSPACFVMENVPGFVEMDDGKTCRELLSGLRALGYSVSDPRRLQAAHFGVPQARERLFIVGAKGGGRAQPTLPDPRGWLRGRVKTVADALVAVPDGCPNHVTRRHRPSSIRRYRTLRFGEREQLGRVDRLDPRLPSKTVIAGGSGGGGRSHLHPYIARTLSVRECARLQTFPDQFVFEGSTARQFTQVGNAVPPMFATAIAAHVLHEIFGAPLTVPSLPPYLQHESGILELCARLYRESHSSRPEWIYFDSTDQDPAQHMTLLEVE